MFYELSRLTKYFVFKSRSSESGFRDSQAQLSDEDDSVFHRGSQSASFSARVKRTRDTFLTHILHGVGGGGGGGAVAALVEGLSSGGVLENEHAERKGQ